MRFFLKLQYDLISFLAVEMVRLVCRICMKNRNSITQKCKRYYFITYINTRGENFATEITADFTQYLQDSES